MKHEKLVGTSVGLSLVGGSFTSSEYLHEIGDRSLARLPEGSTYHPFVFTSVINLGFMPLLDTLEPTRLAKLNKRISDRHGGRPVISVGHSYGATLIRKASRLNSSVGAVVELAPPI